MITLWNENGILLSKRDEIGNLIFFMSITNLSRNVPYVYLLAKNYFLNGFYDTLFKMVTYQSRQVF